MNKNMHKIIVFFKIIHKILKEGCINKTTDV